MFFRYLHLMQLQNYSKASNLKVSLVFCRDATVLQVSDCSPELCPVWTLTSAIHRLRLYADTFA